MILLKLMFRIFSFIFFIPMPQTTSIINRSDTSYFYTHQITGMCAGLFTCNRTHQMGKTEHDYNMHDHSWACSFSMHWLLDSLLLFLTLYLVHLYHFFLCCSFRIPFDKKGLKKDFMMIV